MKNENEKKGLFERLTGFKKKKNKKKSCCCNFEIEEIPEENDNKNEKEVPTEEKGNSCCK